MGKVIKSDQNIIKAYYMLCLIEKNFNIARLRKSTEKLCEWNVCGIFMRRDTELLNVTVTMTNRDYNYEEKVQSSESIQLGLLIHSEKHK